MKRRSGNPQAMTYDQVEQRKDRGAEGLRRLGEEERADNLENESVEDFAERKKITIVNPRKTGKRGRRKNLFGLGGGRKVVSREEAQELQQDAARSHCNKGEYKQAQKTARMSPRRFARQRGMQLEGVVSRTKKKVKRKLASKLLPFLSENPRRRARRRNGEMEDAKKMFSKFHGRRPETIEEVQVKQNDRRTLAGLGVLMFLRTDLTQEWNGKGVGIHFSEKDRVIVACDPQGNQLYFLGGNQDISSILPRHHADGYKDFVYVGECSHIIYTTDKDFDNFEEKDYQHEFGEETGERPKLMFDCLNKQLYLIGGAYQVKREGIVN